MRLSAPRPSRSFGAARIGTWMAAAALALAAPGLARAQQATEITAPAIGERYHVELAGTIWNPDVNGQVSSEQFGILGDQIDFVNDLAFQRTKMKDIRIVLRPTKKARFRIQYTPVVYQSDTIVPRTFTFNGQRYDVNMPINSEFDWKVLRLGYEYDFLYKPRGFVGVLLEGRLTQMTANLAAPFGTEFTTIKAPLPAIGVVGRAYVLPDVAIDFEVSGLKIPQLQQVHAEANYYDWDISGTFNVTNNVGVQAGWRRMTTFLDYKNDTGNVKFQGLWFGAVVRY
jgi:hypothetical protein